MFTINRYLYLLGGHSFQAEANKDFIEKSGGKSAKIALFIMNRPGWENYVPLFKNTWGQFGVTDVEVVVPNKRGEVDIGRVKKILSTSSGIFIGGGDTLAYHHHYATSPIKEMITTQYKQGIPIAGNSAGALILPECCLISPEDNEEGTLLFKKGIGLISNILISVHFTEWNDKKNLVQGMESTRIMQGIGIDENACAVFKNEKFHLSYGSHVHRIKK